MIDVRYVQMKQKLYPKTKRVDETQIQITEKLDGSNIGFFNCNGELIIAQRNNVYTMSEVMNLSKDDLYKNLREFIFNHGKELLESLYEGSGFFAEWVLTYNFGNHIHMFAKANIKLLNDSSYEVYNIYYEPKLFIYPFKNQEIPKFISIVPMVIKIKGVSIEKLNKIYDEYTEKVQRNVEGFVVIYNSESIQKYVRMKDGTLKDHFW